MARHGRELGADLARLYQVGAHELPAMSTQHYVAEGEISGASPYPFMRSGDLGLGSEGPWPGIHLLIQAATTVLHSNATTLETLGSNLVATAQDLAATDREAGHEFERRGGELR